MSERAATAAGPRSGDGDTPASLADVFWYFLKLGWLAFGGPVGQIGLMHLECVERRRWISEDEFLRALNFCHMLPGPEATQMAIYIGYRKRGYLGGLLAGALFLLPGYLTLVALGWIYVGYGQRPEVLGVLWGFRPVGLALILAALVRIGRAALKTRAQQALAALAFVAFFFLHVGFVYVLGGCGLIYLALRRFGPAPAGGAAAVGLFLLPGRAEALSPAAARLLDISRFFLEVGLVSFGGAYAVLPFLREGAVSHYGWITDHQMVDALALGETTPGPLISIGIFIGYLAGQSEGVPLWGATCATFWLFLPSFVCVLGGARYVDSLTRRAGVKTFLSGVTAGVVGLMLSISVLLAKVAFMPRGRVDLLTLVLGLAAFAVLTFWKQRLNVVAVVLAGGALGLLRALAPGLFGGPLG